MIKLATGELYGLIAAQTLDDSIMSTRLVKAMCREGLGHLPEGLMLDQFNEAVVCREIVAALFVGPSGFGGG